MAFKAKFTGLKKAVEDTLAGKVPATAPTGQEQMQLSETVEPAPASDSRTIRVVQAHIDLSRRAKSPTSATHNPIALAIVSELQRPDLVVMTWNDGKVRIGKSCYELPPAAVAADRVWVAEQRMEPFEFELSRKKVAC